MIDLSVILPIYNQADIITPVYKDMYAHLQKLRISFEIILVENGSTDGTEKVTQALASGNKSTFAIQTTKGYGSAVIAGLAFAHGKYICYMPSDGQVDLGVFPNLWAIAKTNSYHIVKVKRIHRESWLRTATSQFFTTLLRLRFGTPTIDINGSPRILKRKDIESLHLHYRDSFLDAEMTIKAAQNNWKIVEIPMENLPRYGGTSSRSWRTYMEFIHNILMYRDSLP